MAFVATPVDSIAPIVAHARESFLSGAVRPVEARLALLRRLRVVLASHEDALLDALAADLGKPRTEAWVTELGFCINDIDHTTANLHRWCAARKVPTPAISRPGTSRIIAEPLGVVCVIAPWNYPVQLLLVPAIAAIAAGNTVVLKPSELVPNTAAALAVLVDDLRDPAVLLVQGGVEETTALLQQRFDHIIYTGNARVAKIVMHAAAEHLTPVTLELGGKSPAIVSRHADIAVTARRIAWGKFVNAGQTCIAPDYVLVERDVHDELVEALGTTIVEFYGADPSASADYARIVDDHHFRRLDALRSSGTVAHGGRVDAATRYIEPTVLTGVLHTDPVMTDEIFGPILPVIAVNDLGGAIDVVNSMDKPLALYSFSADDDDHHQILGHTSSGGTCINGTLLHVANPHLPFGGVGGSGMGAYHGRFGFDTFSHHRAVYTRSTTLDPKLMYPPYSARKAKLIRAGLRLPDPRDVGARLTGRLRDLFSSVRKG